MVKLAALGMCVLVGAAIATAAFRDGGDPRLASVIVGAEASGMATSGWALFPTSGSIESEVKRAVEQQTKRHVSDVQGCGGALSELRRGEQFCTVVFGNKCEGWVAGLRDDRVAYVAPASSRFDAYAVVCVTDQQYTVP